MKQALILFLILLVSNLYGQLIVTEVSPDHADPGTTGLTVTFTLPDTTPPTPPVDQIPTSVTIGTISGTSITRVSFDTVTAVFDIPFNEVEEAKDVAVIFAGPTLTKTAGFTVGEVTTEDNLYPNGPPSSGYNLLSTLNSTSTYLIDNDKNIVKTWNSSYNPGNSVYLLEDGTLMRTANTKSTDFDTGGTGGRVEQYDWEGNLIWEYDYNTANHRQHHDIKVLPNGNILMIAWELKTQAEAEAAGRNPSLISEGELWPDAIIEVAPTGSAGGTIVWEWHSWDHLIQDYNASADNYGTVADHPGKIDLNYTLGGPTAGIADWHHINSIDYNAELDQILLSVHNFSEIWIIDHNTTTAEAAGSAGDLLYRWGNPAAYDSGDTDDQQLFLQHDAKWIEDHLPGAGNILIFNNGQGRSDGDYSSVDEIIPPVGADGSYTTGLPLAPTWSYTNPIPTDFYGANISGAQRLPNGNTLICEGPEKYAFEVTSAGDLVWDYASAGSMFRFERYTPDFAGFENTELALPTASYTIVDTGQDGFYNNSVQMTEPGIADEFYGQDATHSGNQPKYQISADGLTVYDYNTGLTWTRSHDINGDGLLNYDDKLSQSEAVTHADVINASSFGGYSDWRLPSIKEIYSLMDFRGKDPSPTATSATDLYPFIDTNYFEIGPGDLDAGDRIIDGQFATTTIYVDKVMSNQEAVFGLNLIDGRIKGYPTQTGKLYYVYYCRGNTAYGTNNFADNGDGTVTDHATGLMWAQADDGSGMDWSDALSYAEASELAGHTDWRLPNTKELQSLLDYTRSPSTTASAAIDPVFDATQITNMAGDADYPWYWTGTTHLTYTGDASSGSYVCFGRGTGTMDEGVTIIDVHGAGCQRGDPKTGDAADYPSSGHGPQGDVQRVFNHVRLVRTVQPPVDSVADGISDAWRSEHFGGDGTTTNSDSEASADPDGDGCNNLCEYIAHTDPNDPTSHFNAKGAGNETSFILSFDSSADRVYTLWRSIDMSSDSWVAVAGQIKIPGSGDFDTLVDSSPPTTRCFYRVSVTFP